MAGRTEEIASLTMYDHSPQLQEQVFLGRPFSKRMLMSNKVNFDSGYKIIRPIQEALNNSVKAYSGYESITHNTAREFGNLEYDLKSIMGGVRYNQDEIDINDGARGVVKLISARIDSLAEAMAEKIEIVMLGNKDSSDSDEMSGLKTLVGTRNNAVGGVTPSQNANTWWNPLHIEQTETIRYSHFSRAITSIDRGGSDTPSVIVSMPSKWWAFDATLQANERYIDETMANAGFLHLMVKTLPYFYVDLDIGGDANAAFGDDNVYILNEKYLEFVCQSGNWMKTNPFHQLQGQTAWESLVSARGNFITTRRRAQCRMNYNIPT